MLRVLVAAACLVTATAVAGCGPDVRDPDASAVNGAVSPAGDRGTRIVASRLVKGDRRGPIARGEADPGPAKGQGLGAGPEPRRDPGEPWYEAKHRDAAARLQRGDALGALKIIEAILVLEPDCPIRDRLVALKVRAEERVFRTSVLHTRLVPKARVFAPGEELLLSVVVENRADGTVELAVDPDVSEIFGALEVEVVDVAPDGEQARLRETRRIRGAPDVRIEPGERWELEIALPPPAPGARVDVFRRITVSGRLRPFTVVAGERSFERFLPLLPVEVYVLDGPHARLAADPLLALRRTLRDLALGDLAGPADLAAARALERRLFAAALLLAAPADRERAVALLLVALAADGTGRGALGHAVMPALAAATGEPFHRDRARWLAWGERRRGRPHGAPAPGR